MKRNSNGYNNSLFIVNQDGKCIICGYIGDTARHEIFHGPNRQISKRLDAQRLIEDRIGHDGYMAEIGRNYLEPEEWKMLTD